MHHVARGKEPTRQGSHKPLVLNDTVYRPVSYVFRVIHLDLVRHVLAVLVKAPKLILMICH